MIFGPASIDEARGAVMAHSQRVGDRMIRKGALLDDAAIDALRAAGRTEVICARLEPGDVPEDVAAARLADPLLAPGIGRSRAATGRVNLLAEAPGLLRVDAARIERLNALDEALTVGTLPDYAVVAVKEMIATIKVIPFAVPGRVLSAAEALARPASCDGDGVLRLHPFRPLKVGLVVTELPGMKPGINDKAIAITDARVSALTGSLLPPVRCAHQEAEIADGLRDLLAAGADLLLVIGASAVVDRRDVGPAGIVRAGGVILHFGMPVDPGNLICLGCIGPRPALVLPGCARSPTLNGIDFVLSRLFAGLPLSGQDLMRMGVGGLLKESDIRPMPRPKPPDAARAGSAPPKAPAKAAAPAIAAIVLAAGRSSRMAPHNKLLIADRSGRPMVARVADNILSSGARPVLAVTGYQAEQVEQALGGRPVRRLHAPDYAEGLAASLKAGIAAVPPECAAALVCLGDMPLVTGRMIDRLLAAYDPSGNRLIVLPTCRGEPGNPILWDRRFFPEILQLSGDAGARSLLRRHRDAVAEVEIGDDAVLRDFDTTESLATLPRGMRPEGVE